MTLASRLLASALLLTGCASRSALRDKDAELGRVQAQAIDREKELLNRIADLEGQKRASASTAAAAPAADGEGTDETEEEMNALRGQIDKLSKRVEELARTQRPEGKPEAKADTKPEAKPETKVGAEPPAPRPPGRDPTVERLSTELRPLEGTGQVTLLLSERGDQLTVVLPSDLLFDTEQVALRRAAQPVISRLAQTLQTLPEGAIAINVHTDDIPLHGKRFGSKWELTARRAADLARILVQRGVRPATLVPTGYGDARPVVKCDSAAHCRQDRRVEIVITPAPAARAGG